MNKTGIVVALPQELETLGNFNLEPGGTAEIGKQVIICMSGIGRKNAIEAGSSLLKMGVQRIISWGTAVSLKPGIKAGTLLIPEKIITVDGETIESTRSFLNEVKRILPQEINFIHNVHLEIPKILTKPDEKKAVGVKSGADTADMESGALAALAQNENLPFLAIRAISDSAELVIPPPVINSFTNHSIDTLKLITKLTFKPKYWFPTLLLALSFYKAKKTLSKTANYILPVLNNSNYK